MAHEEQIEREDYERLCGEILRAAVDLLRQLAKTETNEAA